MKDLVVVKPPEMAVQSLPDTDRYKCRYTVKSGSSSKLHMVSYDAAPNAGYWTCSCFGNRRHGQCKHLTAAGLKGRKYGKTAIDAHLKKELNHVK